MNTLLELSGQAWTWLARASWQAAVLVGVVLAVQGLLGRRLAPQWRCALWWLVVLRLMLPVWPGSALSLFNWIGGPSRAPDRPALRVSASSSPVAAPLRAPGAGGGLPETTPGLGVAPDSLRAAPVRASTDWRRAWLGVWLGGVVLLSGRVLFETFRLRRRLRGAAPACDNDALALLEDCRLRMGLARPLALVETDQVQSPALYGVWRPRLLLPAGFLTRFNCQELRHVFLHETAHVRRGDIALNWLATVLQVVHWFNPLVWLAFSRMRADRELACDAMALAAAQPGERRAYGQTILRLLEELAPPAALPGMVGILEDRAQIKQRIRMIASFRHSPGWSRAGVAVVALTALTGLTDAPSSKPAPREPVAAAPSAPAPREAVTPVAASQPVQALPAVQGTNAPDAALVTRIFKVDSKTMQAAVWEWVRSQPGAAAETQGASSADPEVANLRMRDFLRSMGVDLARPKAVFFNTRMGTLMVRATAADHELLGKILQALNDAPPQLLIQARFVEVLEGGESSQEFVRLLGLTNTPSAPAPQTAAPLALPSAFPTPARTAPASPSSNLPPATMTAILAPDHFARVLKAMEGRPGVDILSTLGAATFSGRQTQMKAVDIKYVVTDLEAGNTPGAPSTPITEPIECGATLDITPVVAPDGRTIRLTVIPSLREFTGYDIEAANQIQSSTKTKTPCPLPVFRLRQVVAGAAVQDGQTLVLCAGTVETVQTIRDRSFFFKTTRTQKLRKTLYIFVTPTIIDAAGNPNPAQPPGGARSGSAVIFPPGR